MYNGADKIEAFIPNDNCKQSSALKILKEYYKDSYINVLDLGCGNGDSVKIFRCLNQEIKWIGLDVETSDNIYNEKNNGTFVLYDGINIPFEDNHFDLIFSRQVLEHVNKPYEIIKETARVLKNDGLFIGSTSNLEAFHGLSTFNYTPYGFTLLFEEIPLKIIEIRPGIDFFTLWVHRISNRFNFINRIISRNFENESLGNSLIEFILKINKKSNKEINLYKLLLSGHFCFAAKKNSS